MQTKRIVKYTDINLSPERLVQLDEQTFFSRACKNEFWKLHGISSYLAMFSPKLPQYFIGKYTKPSDIVMDNFSGRGTTGLVCRQLERNFIGSDLNPYAYVLNKFKFSKIEFQKINRYLHDLESKFKLQKHYWAQKAKNRIYDELRVFYSESTLSQLVFIRETIGQHWKRTNKNNYAVLAIMMGLMHGPMRKDGTTIYFSLSMPNTISFTPNYVKKYVEKHHLIRPDVNIFQLTKQRLKNLEREELQQKYTGKIYLWDATKVNRYVKDHSVALVITSPPYLNIVNYTKSNWLRLWLLGFDRNQLSNRIQLSDKLTRKNYTNFIKKYLLAIQHKVKPGGKVCLVVGDIYNEPLIENVWKEIGSDLPFRFHEVYYDYKYDPKHKITSVMTHKNIKATIIEKVLVLEKI